LILLELLSLRMSNDKYFARGKAEKAAKKEGDIFDAKKEAYKPSEQRKTD